MSLTFNFYGCHIEVTGDDAPLLEEIRRDYAYFLTGAPTPFLSYAGSEEWGEKRRFAVQVTRQAPDYAALPALPASLFTPRSVGYYAGQKSYVDYFGRGLALVDRAAGRCDLYSADFDCLREMAYYYILSTVGQYLDSQGLHRVHALGVTHRERAVLLLLPSGGGKSTLSLELLRRPGFTLLGEDTPLIDRRGRVLPFPLRLGVCAEQEVDIPETYLRTMQRMEFGPKKLIDLAYFQDRLSGPVEPGLLLVGQRNLGAVSEIVPLSPGKAFKALLKYMIVGLGIYQGLEFLLERGTGELASKGSVVLSRTRNAVRLLRRVPAYRFVLGRDRALNCCTLLDFLESR